MLTVDYLKASDGTGNASIATVQATRAANATTLQVDTVENIPPKFIATMGTPHTFTDPVTGETITVISEATAVDFAGHVSSTNLEIDSIAPGYTDAGSAVGDIVIIRPTTYWADNVAASVVPTGAVSPFAGSSAPNNWLLCDGSAVSRTTYANLFATIGTTFGAGNGSTTFNLPDLRSRSPVGAGTGTYSFTFASTDVNTTTDQITVTANPEIITGRKIRLTTTGSLPTGLSLATDYYIIVVDSTHIKLATSLANAVAGTAIDITATGSGTNTATGTLSARTLGDHGGQENHALTISEIPSHDHTQLIGGTVRTATSGSGTVAGSANNSQVSATGGSGEHNNMQPFLSLNYIIKT